MRSKILLIGLALTAISVLIVGIAVFISGGDLLGKHGVSDESETNGSVDIGDNATLVTPSGDELLGKYEKSDRLFKRAETGNMIVYGHQRKIDNATVEGDRIVYQFDKDTKELKKKIIHWRDDLPEHLPPVIHKEEAEFMVKGKVLFTKLYFISQNSFVHPIKPTPKNPCWVVRSVDWKGNTIVTVIDAVEGKILGYGIPPP